MQSKANQGTFLRTEETWRRYKNAPRRGNEKCFMCNTEESEMVIMAEFEHWLIVENQYPYDAIADVHHLLIPRRHVKRFEELNHQEMREHDIIMLRFEANGAYDCRMNNFPIGQSHPTHYHTHLLRWHRRE